MERGLEPVFDLDELYTVLTRLSNPNHAATFTRTVGMGGIQLELATPSLADLRTTFKLLHPSHAHLGVDDRFDKGGWQLFFFLACFLACLLDCRLACLLDCSPGLLDCSPVD